VSANDAAFAGCERSEGVSGPWSLATSVRRPINKWASGVALYFKQNNEYDETLLCEACCEYITNVKSRNDDGSIVWQCFVYKILRDHLQRMQFWLILPRNLREWWWINYARGLPKLDDISLEYPEAIVRDGSVMIEELRNMKTNLGNIGWAEFMATWERHQIVPLVCCPWGCSEYFVSVNSVAFNGFIDWYLEGSVECYSPEKECHCCKGFRKNAVSSPVHILNNHDSTWQCLLTLNFVDGKEIRV
jgi:hypothetical protein